MAKFAGKRGDETWGPYNYPVTPSQKMTLEGLEYMMSGLPTWPTNGRPKGFFCSQMPNTGVVVIGLNHRSITVHRNGRIERN